VVVNLGSRSITPDTLIDVVDISRCTKVRFASLSKYSQHKLTVAQALCNQGCKQHIYVICTEYPRPRVAECLQLCEILEKPLECTQVNLAMPKVQLDNVEVHGTNQAVFQVIGVRTRYCQQFQGRQRTDCFHKV